MITGLLYCHLFTLQYAAVQALSKALLDLRADMVSQAQSEVLANAEQAAAEINVQRLVEKRTKELQVPFMLIIFLQCTCLSWVTGCSVTCSLCEWWEASYLEYCFLMTFHHWHLTLLLAVFVYCVMSANLCAGCRCRSLPNRVESHTDQLWICCDSSDVILAVYICQEALKLTATPIAFS